jgi:Pyruvate/2-oxoacid:ferredoxin oxidoreductase delta subunit
VRSDGNQVNIITDSFRGGNPMKNQLIKGHEIAPNCCIVCGQAKPIKDREKKWSYIAGTRPPGAIVCSDKCLRKAIKRHETTGRVDTPEMRMYH